jgi:phosphoenolpyruvate carboxylase
MEHPRDDGPQREDAERQQVERIMRAAEEHGHDPGRVARALNHAPLAPVAMQHTTEVKRRPAFARFLARGFARRS